MSLPSRSTRLPTAVGAIILLAACLLAAVAAQSASGVAAEILGDDGRTPPPSCPKDCNAFGHVTGFQVSTDNEHAVFKAREDGKIVAWSVDTNVPPQDPYRNFFESQLKDETFDKYGASPTAGLSVLKKVGRGRFKLTKKSPIVDLTDSLGREPIFTLKRPLRIQKGRVVALTTPTWITNFGLRDPSSKDFLSSSYKWRASRRPNRCDVTKNPDGSTNYDNLTKLSHPHVKKGSIKKYGCLYTGADILYRAYFVPDK